MAVASGEGARLRTDAAVREAALRIQNTRCGTTRFSRRLTEVREDRAGASLLIASCPKIQTNSRPGGQDASD